MVKNPGEKNQIIGQQESQGHSSQMQQRWLSWREEDYGDLGRTEDEDLPHSMKARMLW